MKKSYIHLIRHGTTEGNQKRWYYGSSDIPLVNEGIEEIKKYKEAKVYPEVEDGEYYTSGLVRTNQTLDLIYGEREYIKIEDLQELKFGVFEKKSYEELKSCPDFKKWVECDGEDPPKGGEKVSVFRERVIRGFDFLYERQKEKDISSIVICHGGVIATIMNNFFPKEAELFFKWIPEPGRGYTLELENGEITNYITL